MIINLTNYIIGQYEYASLNVLYLIDEKYTYLAKKQVLG